MANKLGMPKGRQCVGWSHPGGNYTIIDYRIGDKGLGEIRINCHVAGLGCMGREAGWRRKTDFSNGGSQSCGCLKKQILSDRQTTHGDSRESSAYFRLYNAWRAINERCKPGYQQARDYYEKGVSVCRQWADDYEQFKNWSIKNGWAPGLEIDRINNAKGYSPENCRWSTTQFQRQNRDVVKTYEYNGIFKNLSQWANDPLCAVSYPALLARVRAYGWAFEKALLTPPRSMSPRRSRRDRLRSVYHSMISRCHSEGTHAWVNYGGRGIAVCDEWRESLDAFLEWATPRYVEGYQLDRIDNSRGYTPSNCRFVSRLVNARNRRNTVLVSAFGKTLTPVEWVTEPEIGLGVNEQLIRRRLRFGWSHEDVIAISKGGRRKAL